MGHAWAQKRQFVQLVDSPIWRQNLSINKKGFQKQALKLVAIYIFFLTFSKLKAL